MWVGREKEGRNVETIISKIQRRVIQSMISRTSSLATLLLIYLTFKCFFFKKKKWISSNYKTILYCKAIYHATLTTAL